MQPGQVQHTEDHMNSYKVVAPFEIEGMLDREEGRASILPN